MILMDVVMPGINGFQATRQLTRSDIHFAYTRDYRLFEEVRMPTGFGESARVLVGI